eukprot:1442929-Rhodomonas_salina.1
MGRKEGGRERTAQRETQRDTDREHMSGHVCVPHVRTLAPAQNSAPGQGRRGREIKCTSPGSLYELYRESG